MTGKKLPRIFLPLEVSGGLSPRAGFTLIELLVVVAIVALLAGLIFPAVRDARDRALRAACASNIRQLVIANQSYATDHGYYVAAAEDVWSRNLRRWHGARTSRSKPFEPGLGPLAEYLGGSRAVKECPAFRKHDVGFESGCGGYGYNVRGVGSRAYVVGSYYGADKGMAPQDIADSAGTVMFADTAFVQYGGGGGRFIEYSFAEAYYHVSDMAPVESYEAVPSIHFRHQDRANVAWVDGHVTSEALTQTYSDLLTGMHVGWFGPADNSLFDPF